MTINIQYTESCIPTYQNNKINKEVVNMKKLVLTTLLGLCSLAFACNNVEDNVSAETPHTVARISEKQLECLAKNMYFEAKNEPDMGIKAVGFVTMNRVADAAFPKTICGVVYQREGSVCQFSWVCQKGRGPAINNQDQYQHIKNMAREIAEHHNTSKRYDPTKGSLFFHAAYINPRWKLHRNIKIGQHIFYSRKKKHDHRP